MNRGKAFKVPHGSLDMPPVDISMDWIQYGFAGFSFLMLVLLLYVLRSGNKERKEFREILNDTNHEIIDAMLGQANTNRELNKTLAKLEASIEVNTELLKLNLRKVNGNHNDAGQ